MGVHTSNLTPIAWDSTGEGPRLQGFKTVLTTVLFHPSLKLSPTIFQRDLRTNEHKERGCYKYTTEFEPYKLLQGPIYYIGQRGDISFYLIPLANVFS